MEKVVSRICSRLRDSSRDIEWCPGQPSWPPTPWSTILGVGGEPYWFLGWHWSAESPTLKRREKKSALHVRRSRKKLTISLSHQTSNWPVAFSTTTIKSDIMCQILVLNMKLRFFDSFTKSSQFVLQWRKTKCEVHCCGWGCSSCSGPYLRGSTLLSRLLYLLNNS